MTRSRFLIKLASLTFVVAVGFLVTLPLADAQACTSSWSKSGYKSLAQIKGEVARRLGNARIVRIELCGSGASAYFRIVAITVRGGRPTREELRIGAR